MKKILLAGMCLFLWTTQALAFGHTTVLGESVKSANRNGLVPVVDGLNNLPLQKNINGILKTAAEDLAKTAGGKAMLSYDITLNRPTVFSVVLKAVGTRTVYQGVNIDNTTGKIIDPRDFFYLNKKYEEILGKKDYVYSEKGLLCTQGNFAPYTQFVPYSSLLEVVNIADGARIIPSYKLTEEAEEKTLSLGSGELVALYLAANPTTGYDWAIANADSLPGFVSMGHSFFLPSNSKGMTGSPGTTIMFFSFAKAGNYTLVLNYERAWEHNPLRTKKYHFVVK